jgi:hypothetical protein
MISAIARRVSGLALLLLLLSAPAAAQSKVPSARPLEALVKGSLMSLNDANLTGDYRVFHARLSEPFRKQYTPERLKATFKEFNEKNVDIDIVTAMTPTYEQPAFVDGEGKLLVRGFFPTEPSRVSFEMDFINGEGEWKLIRINVRVSPAH